MILAIQECPATELTSVVRSLLMHGASANAPDTGGDMPLTHCAMRLQAQNKVKEPQMVEIVMNLLEYGADPEAKAKRGGFTAFDQFEQWKSRDNDFSAAMRNEQQLWLAESQLKAEPDDAILRAARKANADGDASAAELGALAFGHRRPRLHLSAYLRAVEAAADESALKLEFPPDGVAFKPAAMHEGTKALRKAFEGADAFVRDYGQLPNAIGEIVFGKLIPQHKEVYRQYMERYSSEAAQKALSKFVRDRRGTYMNGYEWAFKALIEAKEAEGLQRTLDLEPKFVALQKAEDKPKQRTNSLQEVMQDAAATQRRLVLFSGLVAAAATGGATHRVVHSKEGGASEAPAMKRLFRSHEKVCLGDPPESLLDLSRGGVVCQTMVGVAAGLQFMLDEAQRGTIVLLRLKMRFGVPSDGGWRDCLVNFTFADDPVAHVCELQIMHAKMMTIRSDMGAHKDYAVFRGAVELLEYHGVDWKTDDSPAKVEGSGDANSNDIVKLRAELEAAREEIKAKDKQISELQEQLAKEPEMAPAA